MRRVHFGRADAGARSENVRTDLNVLARAADVFTGARQTG